MRTTRWTTTTVPALAAVRLLTGWAGGGGPTAGAPATMEGEDGRLQVTIDRSPPHLVARDGPPGDATGQGTDGHRFVVGGEGERITQGRVDPCSPY